MAKSLKERYSLLITDDDDECREVLGEFFDREGYRTFRARTGREAVTIAREVFLHFLILDMQLPDLNGVKTFELITAEKQEVVPCIFMSAEASKEQKMRALDAHGFAFVPKPIDINLIRYVVDQLLGKYYKIEP